ncbi:hypothetical protein RG963_09925 [Methanosarcina sp. Z-7115]|uniref:Uncharacterized protein n=1 Tax=Methanosarcina baikalica TaxID=3073890 RepID=A0ABU2D2C1_9EURY|nr:hypothetical protein [Methanosarcina sp. Z-7115]MDR7666086.1 hypothetical protein [Methanosarcina sp. Z-7115]
MIFPGVEKKDISFKIIDSSFYVKATKEGVECGQLYFLLPSRVRKLVDVKIE